MATRTKEAVGVERKLVRVGLIDKPGTYLIRPEGTQKASIPDFGRALMARLKATYPDGFLSGDFDETSEAEQTAGEFPVRKSVMVALGEGKVYSIRSTEYPESSPHDLHSRFVIAGRYRAAGERFRISVSDDPSITGGIVPWLATVEYQTENPRGLIRSAVEIVNAIVVPGRLGIYIEA